MQNFLKNILGQRVNPSLCEQAWGLISKALEEQKASKEQNGNTNKNGDKETANEEPPVVEEKKKKRRNEADNDAPVGKKKKGGDDLADAGGDNDDEEMDQSASAVTGKVKWGSIAKTILRGQDDKELPLKKFQKKIIPEYLSRTDGDTMIGDQSVEVLWSKCLKKLSKNPKFKIHKERIKLVG